MTCTRFICHDDHRHLQATRALVVADETAIMPNLFILYFIKSIKQYRITMGPELLQRKLPLQVPTVALPSSDLSLSNNYGSLFSRISNNSIFFWGRAYPKVVHTAKSF